VLVGAVITLNVALGGMKGITLVQAFQYWAKMFAISVPIFVLMAVYGSYGKQLKVVDPYVEDSGFSQVKRQPLPAKAPQDQTWLSPFGPLTTKAAKAAAAALTNTPAEAISLRSDLSPDTKMTVNMSDTNIARALGLYAQLTGRTLLPRTNGLVGRIDTFFGGRLSRWGWVTIPPYPSAGIFVHGDGLFSAGQVKGHLEGIFRTNGVIVVPQGESGFRAITGVAGDSGIARQKAWLAQHEKPLALLYTYSLIIALVCGTAGLPHILVRFYTNPDGVAAKRTTMWVMILIGVFYLFPPVFGVMGRNLMPDLYNGLSGVKGTDGVVLRLPTILHEKYGVLGSILSGITCAGAFAAFMSTFSGLLVSMTGALAHDVYGRMLNPQSTPHQRLRAFKIFAVAVGGVAILLGTQVEQLQINFMVGQAFAIAAASYFPLLFMSTWWRGMTARGAATGMLTGGVCALAAVTLTNFSDLKWLPLDGFWKSQPLLRILCEQPAIWTVPLAIGLMIIVSRVTRGEVPTDVRMKMLVLHAPEQLGLKQEYIQEHQQGH
jgi:Na+(H+)/acetate symporter ActP